MERRAEFRLREPWMESDDNVAVDRGQREEERGMRRREKKERGNYCV